MFDEVKAMKEYYNTDMTQADFEKKHNRTFNSVRYLYSMNIIYDKKAFLKIIQKDYSEMTIPQFVKKHGVSKNIHPKLRHGYHITAKYLVSWLRRMNIPYELTFEQASGYTTFHDTLKVSRESYQAERKPKALPIEMREHLKIIDTQYKITHEFLREKGLSIDLISRIEDRIGAMIRFAVSVGIDAEKHGISDQLILQMAKKEGIL